MTNEKRLIDADEALRMMRNSQNDNPCTEKTGKVAWEEAHNCAISCVEACPPVDAVEVVRCKDCKHRKRPCLLEMAYTARKIVDILNWMISVPTEKGERENDKSVCGVRMPLCWSILP